jgi:hypothetical protein
MRRALTIHPDSHCRPVAALSVAVTTTHPGRLKLDYILEGDLHALSLPAPGVLRRGEKLSEHTCFEVFLRTMGAEAYYEFNFAPAREWAAYRFDDYRNGMSAVDELESTAIEVVVVDGIYRMAVELDTTPLTDLHGSPPWRMGLSAVVEERDGNKSYWALAHGPGKPDFHHKDCFTIELEAFGAA